MQHHLRDILLVGTGGFAGSICRYLISTAMTAAGGMVAFPIATLTVNAAGSLLIGLIMAIAGSGSTHLLLAVGFCGGFTTFSTFSAETLAFMRSGNTWTAAGYAAASVLICVAMAALGLYAGGKLKGI